ncbi:MAG: tandem-95 repeat protein, partial [Chloroflexi bacterium]|nr:tandem-95 repeat protein [Chloroflexota bacterium]
MNNSIGQQFDAYRITDRIGTRDVATIYKAVDVNTNKTVTFKLIHPEMAQHAPFQIRFLQTVQTVIGLKHPSIAPMISYGQHPDFLYIVTALLAGNSLSSLLAQVEENGQVVTLPETLTIIAQVADALEYAHEQGIVHGNIKPANLILKKTSKLDSIDALPMRTIITDFELARLSDSSAHVLTGDMVGMLPYLSPEQCLEQSIDGRSDIYSLGIILFQLVTGKLPFSINTPMDAVSQHPLAPIPDPRQFRASVPASIAAIIIKALAKKPEARFQHARHLAHACRKVRDTLTAAQTTADSDTTSLLTAVQPQNGRSHNNGNRMNMIHAPAPTMAVAEPAAILSPQPGSTPPRTDSAPTPSGRTFIGDKIVITRSGRTVRTIFPDKNRLSIGRLRDNDIVLETPDVSRRHAELSHTSEGWQVMDLASTSGTHIGGNRLPAHTPQKWDTQHAFQIGPYQIRWQGDKPVSTSQRSYERERLGNMGPIPTGIPDGPRRLQVTPDRSPLAVDMSPQMINQPANEAGFRQDPPVPPGAMQVNSLNGRFRAITHPNTVEVTPGEQTDVIIELQNLGQTADYFQFHISGIDTGWITVLRDAVQLAPQEKASLSFTVQPPLHSSSKAGVHSFHLHIETASNPRETAVINGKLTIKPFHSFSIDMQPIQLNAKETCQVTIQNNSNTAATYSIIGHDSAGMIQFEGQRGHIKVNSGEFATIPITLLPIKRPFIGSPQLHTFDMRVTGQDKQQETRSGQLTIKPFMPTWLLASMVTLLVLTLVGAAGYLAFGLLRTQFNAFNNQETAVAIIGTGTDGTRIAQDATATSMAVMSTAVFATQTAEAARIAGDDDGDGLSNVREAEFGTDTLSPDTDVDGLSDGQEVNQFNTDPRNQDTDGDRLLDGAEILEYLTDPRNQDTDGDGVPDGAEIEQGTDPLTAPIVIPTITPTPPPTATLTPGNSQPAATDDTETTNEDEPITIPVLQNDTDENGDSLTVISVSKPPNGNAITNPDSSITYTPDENFNGTDTFTYTISDGNASASATVTVQVAAVNDSPTAILLNTTEIAENSPVGTAVGNLFTTDVDGTNHTYSLIAGGADNASFAINGQLLQTNSNFDYETKASYAIRVQTSDEQNGTFTQDIIINITNSNDPPTNITLSNSSILETIGLNEVVGTLNTADQDSSDIHIYSLVGGTPDNTAFAISGNTLIAKTTFDADIKSLYTIQIQTNDGTAVTQNTFQINVIAVNDAPTVADIAKNGTEDNDVAFTSSDFANAFNDLDGDVLAEIKITQLPLNGALKLGGTAVSPNQTIATASIAALTFTPNADWHGTISFQWSGSDGFGYATFPAFASLTLTPVQDPPTVSDFNKTGQEDLTIHFVQADFTNAFSDADGDTLTMVQITQLPSDGVLKLGGTAVTL